ncbi:endonuclease domain-containing 1 protein-like isoform X2 [Triplophysa rosa]|uniref:endonuclease domain-containing 1 protein-like isoform X2 n=1 Tax=Triplophysa rosa TaxID=992332 RepID=UPI002545C30E|nr:endonuclease domain-containing 1 protein-like isoform X2 [Triplophysa rosa]
MLMLCLLLVLAEKFLISYHFIMTFFLPVVVLWLLSGASAKVVTTFENQCDEFFVVKKTPIIIPTPAFQNICQMLNGVVYYATLYDTSNKIPLYSAYKFEELIKCERPNAWYIEPQLDDNNAGANMALQCTKDGGKQALNDDYVNSNYDKGHLAPVYQASSNQCAKATFTLTNAAPQNKSFNRGQWRVTEKNIANYLNNNCKPYTKYIVTGVVPGKQIIGKSVTVPSHFWTVYCCLDNNNKCQFSQGYIGVNKNDPVQQMNVSALEKLLANLYNFTSFQLFASSTKPTRKRKIRF